MQPLRATCRFSCPVGKLSFMWTRRRLTTRFFLVMALAVVRVSGDIHHGFISHKNADLLSTLYASTGYQRRLRRPAGSRPLAMKPRARNLVIPLSATLTSPILRDLYFCNQKTSELEILSEPGYAQFWSSSGGVLA